jgi:tetratricopeptide (TPR) repeat protein
MSRFGRILLILSLAGACAPAMAGDPGAQRSVPFSAAAMAAGFPATQVTSTGPGASGDRLGAPDESSPSPDSAPPPLTRSQKLDDLYSRLAASTDAAETNGLVVAIDRLLLESGSSTGDLVMARAVAALGTRDLQLSRTLLDKLVLLQPDWAEAWNKRATVRYMMGDERGSMADIAHVLILEPRHFGALSGMGMILERAGLRDDALRAYRRALEIAPQLAMLRTAVKRLQAAVDGQSL